MCSNEPREEAVVPGHEGDCECYVCDAARSVPDAVVPDDFSIHRHRRDPLYVIEFRRISDACPDGEVGARVMLDAGMMSTIGSLMIQHSINDAAETLTGGEPESGD